VCEWGLTGDVKVKEKVKKGKVKKNVQFYLNGTREDVCCSMEGCCHVVTVRGTFLYKNDKLKWARVIWWYPGANCPTGLRDWLGLNPTDCRSQ
jgi:hypothetical protein